MNYYQHTTRRIELGGADLVLYSKAGMVNWDDVAAAHMLLAEGTPVESGMRVLIMEGGAGALAVIAARKGADVHLYNDSLIAARMSALTRDANKTGFTVHESAFPDNDSSFDMALMINPKGRAFARLMLHVAHDALKAGGRMYFCGAKAQGAQAIATDAGEVFGANVITVRTKAHQRLCVVTKGKVENRELPAPDSFTHNDLTFFTYPGVFSREGVDAGTLMLLSTLDEKLCSGRRVLDVGCGCGVIGMSAAKLGAEHVDMSDISLMAMSCGLIGLLENELERRCSIIPSDLYSDITDTEQYDLILSNPPFHAGHSVDTAAADALISGARERLTKGGALRIVANRFLAYNKVMEKVFNKVEVIKEDGKFWVLEGRG